MLKNGQKRDRNGKVPVVKAEGTESKMDFKSEFELDLEPEDNTQGTDLDPPQKMAKLLASDRRARFACIRCRLRKTKCGGEAPCRACVAAGVDCEYPRKPKKVQVLDIEIEEYKNQIQALKTEIKTLTDGAHPKVTPGLSDKVNLSIWLGSASCELVCWNLKQFAIKNKSDTSNEVDISPDFSSFQEEATYDYLLENNAANDEITAHDVLKDLTVVEFDELIDNVVTFINSGYLTIDPIEFREIGVRYFDEKGTFKIDRIETDHYFFWKFLVVLALGEIYSKKSCIGGFSRKLTEVPGLSYFKLVIKHLPSPFSLITIRKQSVSEAFEIIELFGLIAVYLRILDKKNAAVMFTLNALQMCISLNLHKDRTSRSQEINERPAYYINRIWWCTYCLNRFYSSRIGQPLLLSLEEITNNEVKEGFQVSPKTNYEFANNTSMQFYIKLAKIADRITNELYCWKLPFNNKKYLLSIVSIMEVLVEWVNNIPDYLRLKLPTLTGMDAYHRLIYTLHLNYLHLIYLTCIPIVINFAKMKINKFYKHNTLTMNPLNLTELPKNIQNLFLAVINSSQLTINIFMSLFKGRYIRTFGFTDLDYLSSSSIIFIICLILKIENTDQYYSFEDYLEGAMNLMNEMRLNGNLIAKGKLDHIVNLIKSLRSLLLELNYHKLFENLKKYQAKTRPELLAPLLDARSYEIYANSNVRESPSIFSDKTDEAGSVSSISNLDNHFLDEFKLGKDVVDCTFLTYKNEVDPQNLNEQVLTERTYTDENVPTTENALGMHEMNISPLLFAITEEDINFMDQIFENFGTVEHFR